MDAAQMLTEQEITRECKQLARTVQRREGASPRQLRTVDPVTEPIATVPASVDGDRDTGASAPEGGLTERERGILAFEQQWWKQPGAKNQVIRELFGISPSRYYQLLNALVDKPAAMRADPMLIKRLRRVRTGRFRTLSDGEPEIEWH